MKVYTYLVVISMTSLALLVLLIFLAAMVWCGREVSDVDPKEEPHKWLTLAFSMLIELVCVLLFLSGLAEMWWSLLTSPS